MFIIVNVIIISALGSRHRWCPNALSIQKYIVGSVWLCLLVLAGFTKYPLVTCLRHNWLSAFLAHLIAHTYSVDTLSMSVYNVRTPEQTKV